MINFFGFLRNFFRRCEKNSRHFYVFLQFVYCLFQVKRIRERSVGASVTVTRTQTATPTEHNTTAFVNHLNALQKPRNMRTRRLAQAEDDPELNKTAKLATILKDLYTVVITAKGK